MYQHLIKCNSWSITALTDLKEESFIKKFNNSPQFVVINDKGIISSSLFLWAKSIIYRIENELTKKNISIPTDISRMWFNITYNDTNPHWLHKDSNNTGDTSIVIFMTPIWAPGWKGSFHVDGDKFNFQPGNVIVFNSDKYHLGEPPKKEIPGWLRLTCNIVLKDL